MTRPRVYPKVGETYTLEFTELYLILDDSPCLCFTHESVRGVIQNSHLSVSEMLAVPGMSTTRWRFARTTNELIPVFNYCGGTPLTEVLDMVKIDEDESIVWWATPKGFPRSHDLSEAA